jgi:hypothetical protein
MPLTITLPTAGQTPWGDALNTAINSIVTYVNALSVPGGLPTGGTTGQALIKSSSTPFAAGWNTLDKTVVGLANVDNTSDVNKPVSTAQNTAITAGASAAVATAIAALTKSSVGLNNVDNTADTAKPVSTAQNTALNLRLLASANLSDVASAATARTNLALGNVTNTSDANKPVSTAQQAAIDAIRAVPAGGTAGQVIINTGSGAYGWGTNTAVRPAVMVPIVWASSVWQYKGATASAVPSDMATGDILHFIGNPGGSLPSWAPTNSVWSQG